jgi:hypothetical protein
MNLVSTFIAVSSIVFMMVFLSTDGFYYLKYTFSESVSNPYSALITSKSYTSNQTSLDTGCDFLNLCGNYVANKLSGALSHVNNDVIDISYLNSFLELPFP